MKLWVPARENAVPRWFDKKKEILGTKGGSWRSKKTDKTVYHTDIMNNAGYFQEVHGPGNKQHTNE